MPRIVAGIDIGATVRRALGPALEQGIELRRGSLTFTAAGFWERLRNGISNVILIPGTGTLGDVRPVPGDRVVHLGETMSVTSVGGVDGVVWELLCSPAMDMGQLADAPTLSVRRLSASTWQSSVAEPLLRGTRLRTRFRRTGKPYWMASRIQSTRKRVFTVPTGGEPYEVGAAFIATDGTASLEAIAEAA